MSRLRGLLLLLLLLPCDDALPDDGVEGLDLAPAAGELLSGCFRMAGGILISSHVPTRGRDM